MDREAQRSWALVAVAYGAGLAGTEEQFSPLAPLPLLAAQLHAGSAQLGWVMSGFALATLVTAFPAGLVVQRFRVRSLGELGWQ